MLVCRDGESSGAYEAVEVIGRGSFGTVYAAEDVDNAGRRVAMKSITCRCGEAVASGIAEAEILQKLDHPNVLRCYEWFKSSAVGGGQTVWIVLDFKSGGDLNGMYETRRKRSGAPLDNAFVRQTISCVGSALKYIHGRGILHRDVKCANVLLSQNRDNMVLADFGLSCSAEHVPEVAEPVGTPTYQPPEIICGQLHSVASDAWSFGVLSFKLAALRPPFQGRDDLTLSMRILKDQPASLPYCCAADVACTVSGLLAKDRQKRMRPVEAVSLTCDAAISKLSRLAAETKYSRKGSDRYRLSCL
mmetsp:Transcript_79743/g.221950  ORF Transcript_79743/g.221950 Transcript_79743/m.221950 type:complete len:303 (-) Transcript_79743:58-966(-)